MLTEEQNAEVQRKVKAWVAERLIAIGIPPVSAKNEMGCNPLPPRPFLSLLAFPPKPNEKLRAAFERHAREVEMR